jgi:hypothetical protein
MATFSQIDWSTLLVGIILGIPITYGVSILATFHAHKLASFLDKRKLLKHIETKKQALLVFNRITAFHEGKRDRYPFYISLACGALICAIIASTLFIIILTQNGGQYPFTIGYIVVALVAVLAILMAAGLLATISETARQIERFDDYKAEFEKGWGSLD